MMGSGGDMDDDSVDWGEQWGVAVERTSRRMYMVNAQETEGEHWVGRKEQYLRRRRIGC